MQKYTFGHIDTESLIVQLDSARKSEKSAPTVQLFIEHAERAEAIWTELNKREEYSNPDLSYRVYLADLGQLERATQAEKR